MARLTVSARLFGGLFFFVWLVGLSVWTGLFVRLHHQWPSLTVGGLVVIGGINACAFTILRTPARSTVRPRGFAWLTVGTSTSTGLALAGSCAVGGCAAPVAAGIWGLPILNALVAWDAGLAPWLIGSLTGIVVVFAWRHYRRLVA